MDKKAWIIFSVVVVAVLGGLVYLSQSSKIDVSKIDATNIQSATDQNGQIADHVFGKKDSKVVLIEYGDFQCPGCGAAHPNIKAVTEKYEDKIAFVFRNFPLTTIHPNARAAAAAVEAAGLEGKYWQMHDAMFQNQDSWKDLTGTQRTDTFLQYAKTLGVNEQKFTANLEKPSINKKISFDQALGKKVNVSSTPTFFLNGEQLPEDVVNDIIQQDGAKLTKLLDEKLQ